MELDDTLQKRFRLIARMVVLNQNPSIAQKCVIFNFKNKYVKSRNLKDFYKYNSIHKLDFCHNNS